MGLITRIGMFRHGLTDYRQTETTLEEANDLREDGIPTIIERANEFIDFLPKDKEIFIYASPMGRTLHHARIIRDLCQISGLNPNQIQTESEVTEVKDFDWNLFAPLVQGGTIEYAGARFSLDARETNPQGLSSQKYFMDDECHKLNGRLDKDVPIAYLERLARFETFASVKERGVNALKRIRDKHLANGDSVIITTHEALAYHPLDIFTRGTSHALARGEYVYFEGDERAIIVKRVGRSAEGDKEKSIYD